METPQGTIAVSSIGVCLSGPKNLPSDHHGNTHGFWQYPWCSQDPRDPRTKKKKEREGCCLLARRSIRGYIIFTILIQKLNRTQDICTWPVANALMLALRFSKFWPPWKLSGSNICLENNTVRTAHHSPWDIPLLPYIILHTQTSKC